MDYLIHLATLVAIFTILAISLDLVVGYTGLLSVTHIAFSGLSAYAVAILTLDYHVNFFLALLVGIVLAALAAFLVGIVLSKFRGDYYALGTVGFNIIVFSIFLNWQSLTRGPLGIPGILRPEAFGFAFSDNFLFLIFVLALAAFVYAASRFIVSSSFGRALRAIREDEEALSVFGYRPLFFKLAIFVIAAGMAGVAGGLFASYISFVDPYSFTVNWSIYILAMIILGGIGSLRGPILGACVLVLLPEALRFVGFTPDMAAQMRELAYGLLLVVMMLFRPQGFIGKYKL